MRSKRGFPIWNRLVRSSVSPCRPSTTTTKLSRDSWRSHRRGKTALQEKHSTNEILKLAADLPQLQTTSRKTARIGSKSAAFGNSTWSRYWSRRREFYQAHRISRWMHPHRINPYWLRTRWRIGKTVSPSFIEWGSLQRGRRIKWKNSLWKQQIRGDVRWTV